MLVLSRKRTEVLNIGSNIKVHVLCIKGDRVKIGIEAPRDVVVVRSEIQRSKDSEGG